LMEGIRMVDEWPIIEKKIPSMDIVFRPVVDAGMIEVSAAEEEGASKRSAASASNKIRLTPEEERIFRKVDGTRTVQGIIDATGQGEFDTCRILFDLMNRNLVSTVGRGVTKETETSPRARVVSATPGYVIGVAALVLAAAGILAQLGTPFGVLGLRPLMKDSELMLLQNVSRVRLERLDRAILAHHLNRGSVPHTLEELVAEGLVDRSYLKDPWARPFHYALTESGYLLSGVDDTGRTVPPVIERVLPPEK